MGESVEYKSPREEGLWVGVEILALGLVLSLFNPWPRCFISLAGKFARCCSQDGDQMKMTFING